jgi:hypothetical protein
MMADKSPRKPGGKKPGKTLKEKRNSQKAQAPSGSAPFERRTSAISDTT